MNIMHSENNSASSAKFRSSAEMRAEVLAEKFVEDMPKIDSAVKAFISLVAARSVAPSSQIGQNVENFDTELPIVSSRSSPFSCSLSNALICARVLLTTINSCRFSDDDLKLRDEDQAKGNKQTKSMVERKAAQIIWNRVVEQSPKQKASKVFGRAILRIVFPCILKQLQLHQHGTTVPNCLTDFITEFDQMLYSQHQLCYDQQENNDDSALIWSLDGGKSELKKRVEQRAKDSKERNERAARNESFTAALPEILEDEIVD